MCGRFGGLTSLSILDVIVKPIFPILYAHINVLIKMHLHKQTTLTRYA